MRSLKPSLAGGALLIGLSLAGCNNQQNPTAGPAGAAGAPRPPQQVAIVTLRPKSVAINAELPGRITPYLVAEVRPQVAGIIQERRFKEGGEVARGDILYQIDPATYQAAYDSAAAQLARAEAQVPNAQAQLERYQTLSRSNAVTEQQLDQATATLAQAKADVAAAKANLVSARINLDYTRITASISGLIGKSSLNAGALVTASQTIALATIRQLDPIYVDMTQSSANLLRFRRQLQSGKLRGDIGSVPVKLRLEDGSTYDKEGKLEFADISIDESTSTFTVRAVFPNPDRLLLPGMYVRAVIEEGVADGSFLLPQQGVTRNSKGEATAMFVTRDNKVEQRVIGIRRTIGASWLVDRGVNDGDRLIVEGTLKVRPGQDVAAVEVTVDPTTGQIKEVSAGAPHVADARN
ncbi:efflux RND transporter periplasmic adaptor subunit [Terrarubrum flagellatum]|uniref:efflux RND transporter periplasmic adaptor subunit n=1 Tax=Terrirubrum flagellatum TaxID=2895980 RepID=UPI0031456E33